MNEYSPTEILAFWFGDASASPDHAATRDAVWFSSSADFDRDIERRYADAHRLATSGGLDAWEASPQACLALIIILDQFSRNMFRGAARAFAADAQALSLTMTLIDAGTDRGLAPLERLFAYMPLQHGESLAIQELSLRHNDALRLCVDPTWRPLFDAYFGYAQRHHQIIEAFGRFPHRNRALGRASTERELAYLAGGGETFGQAGEE